MFHNETSTLTTTAWSSKKSSKSQKVKTIVRNSCLQQKSPLRASQPTMRNVRTLTQNKPDNDEYDSDAIDSEWGGGVGRRLNQVILFLYSSTQMRKMPTIGQMPHAQDEPWQGYRKLTSLSFNLCFLINSSM